MSKKDKLVTKEGTRDAASQHLPALVEEKKNKVVPGLRFPEFRGSEGWAYMLGATIFDQISNKNHKSDLPILAITQEHGAIPRDDIDYNVTVTDKSLESYKIVESDDFIISLRSFQGGIEYSTYRGICSPAYVVLRRRVEASDIFFKFYFKTSKFIGDLNKNIEGLRDGKMVSYKQFSELLLPLPSLFEQQKIASCLSSLDELIAAHHQKLEALKVHKKGLMKQLFPAEGETVPKLRFPEFKDSGEWVERILSQVADLENGKAHENEIIEVGKFVVVNSKFISSNGQVKKFTNTPFCVAKVGDILMVLSDVPNGKAIAKCFYVALANTYTVNQRVCRITARNVNGQILYYSLNRNEYFLKFDDGVKQTNLRNSDVLNCPVLLPKHSEEQQKIASLLSSLDDLISNQTQKIETLKAHKKGLMQQLFPAINPLDE